MPDTNPIEQTPNEEDAPIKVVDLPIQFDSTNILLHPIGELEEYSGRKFYQESSGLNLSGHTHATQNGFMIGGSFKNLMFEDLDKNKMITLTDKDIMIRMIKYLHEVSRQLGIDYLVYKIIDRDTNNDGKLNNQDINSLYISKLNGSGFRKLTKEDHDLINWRLNVPTQEIFFRTVVDVNKNEKLDKSDSFHNYRIQLNKSGEIFPREYQFLK